MPPEPSLVASRKSLPEEIAALLREEILDGVHPPQAWLRQEHLAQRFGTSQAPIREAFRRLEADGLTVAVPNRGVRVAGLDLAEAEEIGALRLSLEPDLAARAADRRREIDVAGARSAIAAMGRAHDPGELMAANARFHDAVYRAAGRPLTLDLVWRLRGRFERYLRLMWRVTGHAALSNEEHEAMLALLLEGQAKAVRQAMGRHIEGSTAEILRAVRDSDAAMPTLP
jgi:DNA-binding GntR family transcriptional regulator